MPIQAKRSARRTAVATTVLTALVALVAIIVASRLGDSNSESDIRTTTDAEPLQLMTQDPGAPQAHDGARLWGSLVVTADGCLALDEGSGLSAGQVVAVTWPHGWSASHGEDGLAVLRDSDGDVVAVEGDTIGLGGGSDADPPDHMCALSNTFAAVEGDTLVR